MDDERERAWLARRVGQLFGGGKGQGGAALSPLSPAERVNAATLMLQVGGWVGAV